MVSSSLDNDTLMFIDEPESMPHSEQPAWRVLIVDDEPDVHRATLMALRGLSINERPLAFLHAYSAAEARNHLEQHPDLAVILLDVVMESNEAGLQLVRYIRDDLANHALRIILRTGQPGYAPEIETIRAYDINDYQTKSELTRVRLYTSMTVAIRSYCQINQLETNRHGLELIISASNELSRPRGLRRLAEGVVTELCAVLKVREEGLVCATTGKPGTQPVVLAAAGPYAEWIGRPLENIPERAIRQQLEHALSTRAHQFGATTSLFIGYSGDCALAAFVAVDHQLSTIDRRLLEVFCSNISVALGNTLLYQRISSLAYEDPLLRLPNRNSFLLSIDQRPVESNILALIDLDGFADINSILDQSFGDAVLQAFAERLMHHFAPPVILARIGSDVFGLLGPESRLNIEQLAGLTVEPFDIGEESLRLSATAGLVRIENSSLTGAELLKNAGIALKQAKNFNRGQAIFFELAHASDARQRMQMLSHLRLAFSAERLYIAYQPFVDLASGRIVGAEALLRWRTENGEHVPPERFIPLAEQSGLMIAIGDWVMRDAFLFLKRVIHLGYSDFRIAVNVSQVQFREPDFVERLVIAMNDYEISPANVEIELTESVAIDNIELIESKLAAVRAAGIGIAIDNFGTGYSSLNILRQLNADRLKIDRAFVSGKAVPGNKSGIAEMVVRLARQLGLKIIAEGIETEAQCQKLLGLGCREGQGHFFSEPLTIAQFETLLASKQTRPNPS